MNFLILSLPVTLLAKFPSASKLTKQVLICTENLGPLKNNVCMNIMKKFMPKSSFRLPALAALAVLDVLHL